MIQNRAALKSYFNTGDRPTEAQFQDLIDSFIHRTEDNKGLSSYDEGRLYKSGEACLIEGVIFIANTNTSGAFNSEDWDIFQLPVRSREFPTTYEFTEDFIGKIIGFHNGGAVPYQETSIDAASASCRFNRFSWDDWGPAEALVHSKLTIPNSTFGSHPFLQVSGDIPTATAVLTDGEETQEFNAEELEITAMDDPDAQAGKVADYINGLLDSHFTAEVIESNLIITTSRETGFNVGGITFTTFHPSGDDNSIGFDFADGHEAYEASYVYWQNILDEGNPSYILTAGAEIDTEGLDTGGKRLAIIAWINDNLSDFTAALDEDGETIIITYVTPGVAENYLTIFSGPGGANSSPQFMGGVNPAILSKMIPLGRLISYSVESVMIEDSEFITGTAEEMIEIVIDTYDQPVKLRVGVNGGVKKWTEGSILFGYAFKATPEGDEVTVKKVFNF